MWGLGKLRGKRHLPQRISELRQQLDAATAADARVLGKQVQEELTKCRQRQDALEDEDLYQDLPAAQRDIEIERTEAQITRLEALKDHALAKAQAANPERTEAPSATSSDDAVAQLQTQMDEVGHQFETKHDAARLSRYVHDVGYPCQGPRNQWGYAYSLSSERRMHYKDYEMAGEFMTSGEAARELAVSAEREFEVALTTYLLADDADGSLDAAPDRTRLGPRGRQQRRWRCLFPRDGCRASISHFLMYDRLPGADERPW